MITEYVVVAETEEEACDNFWEGSYIHEREIDLRNEEIIEAEEIE